MIAAIAPITARPIQRPTYAKAPDFGAWLRLNHMLVWDYWCQLDELAGNDAERAGAYAEMFDFAKCQYDLVSPAPRLTGTALECTRAEPEESEGHCTAGSGPVVAGDFSGVE
jgi:hypothetical protein